MLKLKITYLCNGLLLNQIKRSTGAALYSVRTDENSPIIGYETIKITIAKPRTIFGKTYPEREHYPNNEEFGALGWAWNNLESAEKHYNELVQTENIRGKK
jgi:hypothetical protein